MARPLFVLEVLAWFIAGLLAVQIAAVRSVSAQPVSAQPVSAQPGSPAAVQAQPPSSAASNVSNRALRTMASFAPPRVEPRLAPTRRAASVHGSIAAYSPELRRFLGHAKSAPRIARKQALAAPPADVASLARARNDAERAHLWRVAIWGTLNAAGGLALVLANGRQQQPAYWGFGAQSSLWGVVNIGIATAGLAAGGDVSTSYEAAVSAERMYHDILLFNLGLNVAYSSVGTTLVVLSYRGVDNARSLRGHGSSLIMQGAGLLVLDAIAFLGSRTRLAGLLDMAGSVSARALPTGFAVSLSL